MGSLQFIGYQLQTAVARPTNRRLYPGLRLQKDDIEVRCQVMADAIFAAASHRRVDPTAQKVFVAPEFFFRGGQNGAYEIENISYINERMDYYLGGKSFQNWIFVLGTALAAMPREAGSNVTETLNISIVRKGGVQVSGKSSTLKSSDTLLVYKEYVSAIDFCGRFFGDTTNFYSGRNPGLVSLQGQEKFLASTSGSRQRVLERPAFVRPPNRLGDREHVPASGANLPEHQYTWRPSPQLRQFLTNKFYSRQITYQELERLLRPKQYTTSEYSRTGLGGGTNFSMSGWRFSLEICLDHLQKRAASAIPPDIHLVSSCGMDPKYTVAKRNGFFFLVDGISHSSNKVTLFWNGHRGQYLKPIDSIPMTNSRFWKFRPDNAMLLFESGRGTVHIFDSY